LAIQWVVPSVSAQKGNEKKARRQHQAAEQPCRSRASQRTTQSRGPSHHQGSCNDTVVKLLPLVRRVALKLRGHLPAHVELDDLISDGTVGLIDAVRKFDPAKGVTIESYARYRIRGAILDSLRGQDHASRDMRRRMKKVESVCQALESRFGRPAEDAEIAAAMGLSLEQWYERVLELQRIGFEGTVSRLPQEFTKRVDEEDLPGDVKDNPFERCYRREQRDILISALDRLTARERSIINLYYKEGLTMKQIGARLGIDESRVSQLHSGTMTVLRSRVAEILRPSASGTGLRIRPVVKRGNSMRGEKGVCRFLAGASLRGPSCSPASGHGESAAMCGA
jgi:RNA polymerase sigma factor FliA